MTDEHRGCSRRQFLAYAAVAVPLAACSKQAVPGSKPRRVRRRGC
ncbi:twin-arginine translocation signal domain-containing protein [Saccharopolyspora pogona]|nr:twin-arginine translocation signal domain-containing protein [Saccharopolyspora pogona]